MFTHVVQRTFGGDPRHERGELVDASSWRPANVAALTKLGHLGPAPTGEVPIAACGCGRSWVREVPPAHARGCRPSPRPISRVGIAQAADILINEARARRAEAQVSVTPAGTGPAAPA